MPDFLSIKDAARRLGVKPKEIRRRIKDGELDGFVRLPGGGEGERETGGFGPAAPNRRATPPPERDAHVQRLEETVLVLQSELNTRRQEVEELHFLLREIKDSLPVVTAAATPAAAQAAGVEVAPAVDVLPTAEAALAAPAEPEIDWGAYDAESEQLRATMGRLEALLEQLEAPEPEGEPETEPKGGTEPELEAESEARPEPEPERAPAREPETPRESAPAAEPAAIPLPPQVVTSGVEGTASIEVVTEPETVAPASATPAAPTRGRPAAKTSAAPATEAATDDAPTGEALGRRREKMGVSREALAAFARISWGFVTEVERGRRKDPRSRQRVAAALDAWQKRLTDERRKAAT